MSDAQAAQPYRVLARKYRPTDFAGLIGQDALVRTLTNAIHTGRLAHAFVLTGVRGVGKTTTARIIARALNCVGPDGTGGPTAEPCGVCEHCRNIAEDRHIDVIEMDAASRTGVGEMRELIDGVRYRPTSARFKVYIIDEVHMLSTAAFNALLKTLEEPPEHVKFIFATTEIRKIPVTVLSRCQRFDLRRVDMDVLARHFQAIVEKENAAIDPNALKMICRAADGSVRDGLSLLDQAIAHGAGTVSEEQVRDMLGLADRARVFDLFDALMRGDIAGALQDLGDQYAQGADPAVVLEDMLELTHSLTRQKLAPDGADGLNVAETERVRGAEMARGLTIATLTRTWQMLLKGLAETRSASSPLRAAEMVLIRLAYVTDQPSPADLVESLRRASGPGASAERGAAASAPTSAPTSAATGVRRPDVVAGGASNGATAMRRAEPQNDASIDVGTLVPETFDALVALCAEKREAVLAATLTGAVHLVHFEPGRLEFRPTPAAPADLAQRLSRLLAEWTNRPWLVSISREPGVATLREQTIEKELERKRDAANIPLVQAVLAAFPGATIEAVRDLAAAEPAADPLYGENEFSIGEEE